MADASNMCMNSTGRVGVELFQGGKHRVVVRGIVAYLAKDLGDIY